MHIAVSPEACADWHTLAITHYTMSSARRSLYELQKGCLDLSGAAPSLNGPEMLAGLTLRADYGEGGTDWVDADSAAQDHLRSSLYLLPYLGISEEPSAAAQLLTFRFHKSDDRINRYGGMQQASGEGYAFRTTVSETAVSGRLWLGNWFLAGWSHDPGDQGTVHVSTLGNMAPVLFEITAGRLTGIETVPALNLGSLDSVVQADVAIVQGSVGGSLRATIANHIAPASRVADEWDTATVEIPQFAGYLVGTVEKPVLIFYGVGASTYSGPMGRDVYTARLGFIAEPLPLGMSREAFRAAAATGYIGLE